MTVDIDKPLNASPGQLLTAVAVASVATEVISGNELSSQT